MTSLLAQEEIITRCLPADDAGAVALAAAALNAGNLVVFPTDTVYGVGADPFSEAAIARLYMAKQRPADKGIPVLIADLADLARVVAEMPAFIPPLIAQFWPGPLTLVLPKKPGLPPNLSPTDTIAVRMPDHPAARAFIRAAGGAIAASSANRSTHPPARSAAAALAAFNHLAAIILDGGPSPQEIASTIIDCTTVPPRLLRQGPISTETIMPFLSDAPAS
ncbi:MAG: threonylcarbamoyl-AMP synthase [Anaerolineales bacterium]|nr:threonylcarbamoyl-AMP synthase [Anaerolineales bacterium]MCB8951128.1 threonylcarbamoyl-AMP synthase [Ardenticatenales bacterium]